MADVLLMFMGALLDVVDEAARFVYDRSLFKVQVTIMPPVSTGSTVSCALMSSARYLMIFRPIPSLTFLRFGTAMPSLAMRRKIRSPGDVELISRCLDGPCFRALVTASC